MSSVPHRNGLQFRLTFSTGFFKDNLFVAETTENRDIFLSLRPMSYTNDRLLKIQIDNYKEVVNHKSEQDSLLVKVLTPGSTTPFPKIFQSVNAPKI